MILLVQIVMLLLRLPLRHATMHGYRLLMPIFWILLTVVVYIRSSALVVLPRLFQSLLQIWFLQFVVVLLRLPSDLVVLSVIVVLRLIMSALRAILLWSGAIVLYIIPRGVIDMRRKKIKNRRADRKRFGKSVKKTSALNLSGPMRGGFRI